jgi:hypothetical protein
MEITREVYLKIYKLLDPSPLEIDCGALCGSICCLGQHDDMGIYLLPGEEKVFGEEDKSWLKWEIHDPKDYEFPYSWTKPVYYATCTKPCIREKRPIQCRTFPLAPHLTRDQRLIFIWETLDLPYLCPLIENKSSLNTAFVEGLEKGWQWLLKNKLIRDLIEFDSKLRLKEKRSILPYNK